MTLTPFNRGGFLELICRVDLHRKSSVSNNAGEQMDYSKVNRSEITAYILDLLAKAEDTVQLVHEPYFQRNKDKFSKNLATVADSFSGSWLGYHSTVYYEGFKVPRPGDNFSPEWGVISPFGEANSSCWKEMASDQVRTAIMEGIDKDYEERLEKISVVAKSAYHEVHGHLKMLLAILLECKPSPMLETIDKTVSETAQLASQTDIINGISPRIPEFTRDSTALTQGAKLPTHVVLQAWHASQLTPFHGLSEIIDNGNKLLMYMKMHDLFNFDTPPYGSKVFIGHGASPLWRELAAFLEECLGVKCEEFNRVPTAGLSTKERLESMMDEACFAFLVATAEDQYADKTVHARENVIHEIGLFQGKLGFRRAIVLLEEGCSEFSNIIGLGQIRFPEGNIGSKFGVIRNVLEREGILKVKASGS